MCIADHFCAHPRILAYLLVSGQLSAAAASKLLCRLPLYKRELKGSERGRRNISKASFTLEIFYLPTLARVTLFFRWNEIRRYIFARFCRDDQLQRRTFVEI